MEEARRSESAPQGWPAALVMFHLGMWRERFRDALANIGEGRDYERPPADVDAFNEAELAHGIGTPLTDAAARSDHLLGEIIDLYEKVGERPLEWSASRTTTEAVLRNSFTHPRLHMFEYYHENGRGELAIKLCEDGVTEMRAAQAPPIVLGTVLYYLAGVRAQQARADEAIELVREAIPLRADTREMAQKDPALDGVRDDPRFQELLKA